MSTFNKIVREFFIPILIVAVVFGGGGVLLAQESGGNSETEEERRERLREELAEVEAEIDRQEGNLQEKRQERRSLERDVEILEAEINKAQLEIEKKNLEINNISGDIQTKESRITSLNNEIERKQQSLAELLRQRAMLDNVSLVELALSNQSLSDFFQDVDSVQSINGSLQDSFIQIRQARQAAQQEKEALANQRDQVANARYAVQQEKQTVEEKEAEKEELAEVARSEEQTYESLLAQKRQRAAQIRSQLFSLRQVQAIQFGQALDYAREVSQVTGVRPAFLLAIIQQESNLGQNVGTCNLPDDPPAKRWDNIMKPSRDIEPYKRIVNQLGIEPETMPLSCPFGSGWGGAMGPAQFIPSTWSSYQNRIANALGVSVPNPWEPRHAFMASGVLLADLGASAGTYTAERRAALQYYAGGNWRSPRVAFYGDQVMNRAQNIQNNMIDPIDAAEQ